MTAAAPLTITVGDATAPHRGEQPGIIAHCCNDVGGWGQGFVLAISARWPQPEQQYRRWWRNRTTTRLPLGMVQMVQVEPALWVANMTGQYGIYDIDGRAPIRYDALATCLGKVGDRALDLNAAVHMPRIGCGLAGGTWKKVGQLVQQQLCDRGVPVTVYDLPRPQPARGRRSSKGGSR